MPKYFGDLESDEEESDSDDEENIPRLKMDFYCEVCGISATSFDALQTHFAGIKHNKNLRKLGYGNTFKSVHEVRDPKLSGKILCCQLCDVILTEAEVSVHVGCTAHVTALERAEERFREMDPDKWFVEVTKASNTCKNGYHCSLCQVTLPQFEAYQIHIRGKRHLKAVKNTSTAEKPDDNSLQFWCKICNIFCTAQEALDVHLKGKKHKKRLKNKGFLPEDPPTESKGGTGPSPPSTNPFAQAVPKKIRCTLCDVILSSNTEIQAHLSTTEHYVALRKAPKKQCAQQEMFVPVHE